MCKFYVAIYCTRIYLYILIRHEDTFKCNLQFIQLLNPNFSPFSAYSENKKQWMYRFCTYKCNFQDTFLVDLKILSDISLLKEKTKRHKLLCLLVLTVCKKYLKNYCRILNFLHSFSIGNSIYYLITFQRVLLTSQLRIQKR